MRNAFFFLLFLFPFFVPSSAFGASLGSSTAAPTQPPRNLGQCRDDYRQFDCDTLGSNRQQDPKWERDSRQMCDEWIHCKVEEDADCMKLCLSALNSKRLLRCTDCGPILAAAEQAQKPRPNQEPTGSQDPPVVQNGSPSPAPRTRPEGGARSHLCGDAADCLHQSAELDRVAASDARARRLNYERALRESQVGQASTISAAANLLQKWQQAMNRKSSISGEERSRFQSDQRLIQQAAAAAPRHSGDSPRATFTAEDALRANDPGIMRQLAMHAEFKEYVAEAEQGSKKSMAEEVRYQRLADESLRRVEGLKGASAGSGSPAARALASSIAAGASGVGALRSFGSNSVNRELLAAAEKASSSEASRSASSRGTPGGRTPSAAPDASEDSKGLVEKTKEGSSLRDLLRKRLAGGGGAGGSMASEETGLQPPASASKEGAGKVESADASIQSGREAGSNVVGERLEARFTMSGAENEEAIRRIMGHGAEVGGEQAEWLGRDSASLFDRVKHAHRACLARSCVRAALLE